MKERSLLTVLGNERSGDMSAIFERIRSGGSVEDAPTIGFTKAGTRLDVLLDALPIRDADGRVDQRGRGRAGSEQTAH